MEQTLTLNDGTVLNNSSAAENSGGLWIYVNAEIGFQDLFSIMNDHEKTKRIIAENIEGKKTYRGYKELFYLRKGDNGTVSIALRK